MAEAQAEEASTNPVPSEASEEEKPWHSYTAEDLKRTVSQSTDSAFRSARSLKHNSSTYLHELQDFMPQLKSHYKAYEDVFFKKIKDELMSTREHPAVAGGVAVMAGLLLMRGPRRFLFRNTFGRLQSEEALFVKAENSVKELSLSVDIMKNESKKLLERAALAEKDTKQGISELMNSGNEIQGLAKSVCKVETQAADLMDALREIPGREALKLRAEVASMASVAKQQRCALNKRIMKVSELGIRV